MPSTLRQRGFSLIELMISLLLGVLVIAAAGAIFISNKRVYGATETIGRIQENGRVAFELMSRDLREAGGNPCSTAATVVNQLDLPDFSFWDQYADGLQGFGPTEAMAAIAFGTGAGQRVSGTEAIELHLSERGDIRVTGHSTPSAVIDVSSIGDIADEDVLLICNMSFAFIFQATGVNGSSLNISHNGGGGTGLNCGQEFQFEFDEPRTCSGASGDSGYCFTAPTSTQCVRSSTSPAYVARLQTLAWYIGNNPNGGRSLYRATIRVGADGTTPSVIGTPEEIAEGIEDMAIQYLEAGETDYTAPASVTDWSRVLATEVTLNLEGTRGALEGQYIEDTEGEAIERIQTNVVALRNREGLQ